ncbi:MAG: hypothetical protein KGM24_10195 [Elusimicrobia bacterium]|nr:hypothetical protein [Elusimicrobiota bacterium]
MTAALLACAVLAAARPARAAEAGPSPAAYEARIHAVIEGFTVRSTIGPAETPLPLELSNLLLDHPDLAAYIVRVHKLAPYRITMRGPRQSWADDGDGTRGLVTLVERTENHRLYYGEGTHRSRLFPLIRASAVIAMDVQDAAGPDGRPATRTTFVVYVKIKNRFLAGVVRVLRPFLRRTVVGKFTKAFLVADQVGRLMAKDPRAVAADVRAFPDLSPETRAAFLAGIAALDAPRPAPAR